MMPVNTDQTLVIDTAVSATNTSWVRAPEGEQFCGLEFPSTVASVGVTFEERANGGTPITLKDSDGAAYAPIVAADIYLPLKVQVFAAVTDFRIVFGASEADGTTVRVRTRPV